MKTRKTTETTKNVVEKEKRPRPDGNSGETPQLKRKTYTSNPNKLQVWKYKTGACTKLRGLINNVLAFHCHSIDFDSLDSAIKFQFVID